MNIVWARAQQFFNSLPPLSLSDETRAHRRNLMVALGVVSLYAGAGITPSSVSAAFVSGTVQRPYVIEGVLWIVAIYEMVMFHSHRMTDEVTYLRLYEQAEQFKAAINENQMLWGFQRLGIMPSYENLGHRIDNTDPARIIGTYKLLGASRIGAQHADKTLDQLVALLKEPCSGVTWTSGDEFEYRHQEAADDELYFRKAFPRLRRLALVEIMLVQLPYILFLSLAATKVALTFSHCDL